MPAALLINGNEPESNRTEARVDHAAVAIAQPAIIRTVDVTIGRRTSGHEAALMESWTQMMLPERTAFAPCLDVVRQHQRIGLLY